eukprot:GFYU01010010.1.p1 GENE.GFYU01010010.1~~GFYU01010010.1.p1  ORF type:complete len:299 (+),score=78.22 GFYU01010010.1:118-1014(+)
MSYKPPMPYSMQGSAKAKKKPEDVMNKRIPKNPKYAHVKSALDTGFTINKLLEKGVDRRKDEKFKRLKPSTLIRFIGDEDEPESVYNLVPSNMQGPSAHAQIMNLGGDENQIISYSPPIPREGQEPEAPKMNKSYLLCDLREKTEWENCNIRTSVSYPISNFHHAVNPFQGEVFRYKNQEEKIIVIYDEDERLSIQAANFFYEKGVDNVYVLTGGLRGFAQDFEVYIDGELPPPPKTASSTMSKRGSKGTSSRPGTGLSGVSKRPSSPTGSVVSHTTVNSRSSLGTVRTMNTMASSRR